MIGAGSVIVCVRHRARALARLHPHRGPAGRRAVVVGAPPTDRRSRRAGVAGVGAVPDGHDAHLAHRGHGGARVGAPARASTASGGPARCRRGSSGSGVWVWHRHMRRSAATAPTRLADVARRAVRRLRARGRCIRCDQRARRADLPRAARRRAGARRVAELGRRRRCRPSCGARSARSCGGGTGSVSARRTRPARSPSVLLVIVIGAAAATTLFAIGTRAVRAAALLFDTDPAAEILSRAGRRDRGRPDRRRSCGSITRACSPAVRRRRGAPGDSSSRRSP